MFDSKVSSKYTWIQVPLRSTVDSPPIGLTNVRLTGNISEIRDTVEKELPTRVLDRFSTAETLKTVGLTSADQSPNELQRRDFDRFSLAGALETIGVPSSDKSPEEELVDLLLEAADIEHGLMIQYLYANYSLKALLIKGTFRTIAIEEMGHFVTVQNLLIACKAEPHLGTSDWDAPSQFHPFPFQLEPGTVGSIAKYTLGEMPNRADIPADIEPDFDAIVKDGDAAAGSPVEPHRVGLLYTKIYWLLRRNDHPLADPTKEPWPGFPVEAMAGVAGLAGRHVRDGFVTDARDVNAQPGQWKGNYESVIVAPISDRDSALSAVARVSAQGEGFVDSAQSHFRRFVEAWRLASKTSDLALPAATNPHYANGETAVVGDEITSAFGRQFAQMGDSLYELVLLCMAANLLLPTGTPPVARIKAAQAAIFAMRDCLGQVAGALSGIPLTDDPANRKVCGLPFSIPSVKVDASLKAIVDRASEIMIGLKAMVASIDPSNAAPSLKVVADGVVSIIDDEISPRLASLPV